MNKSRHITNITPQVVTSLEVFTLHCSVTYIQKTSRARAWEIHF